MAAKKRLPGKQEDAALLLARDDKSDRAIAAELGIGDRTLYRWKADPTFARRVDEHRDIWRERVTRTGIAVVEKRIAIYNDTDARLQKVIDERAADPTMVNVPGGTTGLVVAEPMLVKVYDALSSDDAGEDDGPLMPTKQSRIVYRYAVDTGLLKERRANLQQAAQELGQWIDRREEAHDITIHEQPDLSKLSDEELTILEQLTERALGPGQAEGGTGKA